MVLQIPPAQGHTLRFLPTHLRPPPEEGWGERAQWGGLGDPGFISQQMLHGTLPRMGPHLLTALLPSVFLPPSPRPPWVASLYIEASSSPGPAWGLSLPLAT